MPSGRKSLWLVSLVCICLTLFGGAVRLPAASSNPIKLFVEAQEKNVRTGTWVTIAVILQNADNQAVRAPKDYVVGVEQRSPSGAVGKWTVTIKAGQTSTKFPIRTDVVGLIYIRAQHPELLEGGTYIYVRRAQREQRVLLAYAGARMPGIRLIAAPSPAPAGPSLQVVLQYTPQRPIRADGKEPAQILAFLTQGLAPEKIQIQLFSSGGRLDPETLVIPQGAGDGKAVLTSDRAGTVKVQYIRSVPAASVEGQSVLTINFAPAIGALRIRPSPPSISLVETSELQVQLLDDQGNSISTDLPRRVFLRIDEGTGRGQMRSDVEIVAGSFVASTTFRPTWMGSLRVTAFTDGLAPASTSLVVSLPLWLLALSVLGGSVGGFIAFRTDKHAKRWRIAVGLVTGFILYWASIFGILPLVSSVSPVVALNPLSAFALPTLGGWAGTGVFTAILKRLGLEGASPAPSRRKRR